MNIMMSGGADGADLAWGRVAKLHGHKIVHFSFAGHKNSALKSEVVKISQDDLNIADPYLLIANNTLKRHFPTKSEFVNNLLRRNYYQVKDSASCYAISEIKNGFVQGGTSWASQMFIDQHNGESCDCFVFCQKADAWFKWSGQWVKYIPPVPEGVWAGIGTRQLQANGEKAIQDVFGRAEDLPAM